jgi:hypothetical protein
MAVAKNPSGQEVCLLVDAAGGLILSGTPQLSEGAVTMEEVKQLLLEVKQLILEIKQAQRHR